MIIREREIPVDKVDKEHVLSFNDNYDIYKNAIYFDLEHYVYKKPKCVGVFGACYFDEESSELKVTQYMIEHKGEVKDILYLGKKYFINAIAEKKKKYIVTFSGNNDFTVINFLFDKYGMNFKCEDRFTSVDIQKVYENTFKTGVGLKALEKKFGIEREGELISGSNLAKTFHKVLKDKEYFKRMPKDKIEKILVYNEQDVVNLFHIFVNWNVFVAKEKEEREERERIQQLEAEFKSQNIKSNEDKEKDYEDDSDLSDENDIEEEGNLDKVNNEDNEVDGEAYDEKEKSCMA